jgi:hypothetical protein
MNSGPSKLAEALAAAFTPPSCREEVIGDLHERYRSPRQYGLDVLRTVPLVVISRIRRTADPQLVVIQAFAVYVSFLGAAWITDRTFSGQEWRWSRLAIPAATTVLGLILEDAYANPGRRSPLQLVRGPAAGIGLALLLEGVFWLGNPDLGLPGWIALYGCSMGFVLTSAVRLLFQPATNHLQPGG